MEPLIAKVFNLDNQDLIQSVGQGGSDAAIDYRGISNFIKASRTAYTLTADDVAAGEATIEITFDTPFADTDYTITFSVEHSSQIAAADVTPADVVTSTITAAGFQAKVWLDAGSPTLEGTIVTIHTIAIHD